MSGDRAIDRLDEDRIREKGWPCACVRRDRKKRLTHIKINAPELARCHRCGCTREESERLGGRGVK